MRTTLARPTTTLTLPSAATFFAAAVLFHNFDHLRRGTDELQAAVFWVGNAAIALEVALVAMAFMRHRWAAPAATVFGFGLALGYLVVHFTPERSWLSDSFVEGGAAGVSVVAGVLEIAAALALGVAGWLALRRDQAEQAPPLPLSEVMVHPVVALFVAGNAVVFTLGLVGR